MLTLPRSLVAAGRIALLAGASIVASLACASLAVAAPRTHTITIEAMQFHPAVLEISAGDTVVWVNKDIFPHNATAADHSFGSANLESEQSWKFAASKKGVFPYFCTFHPTMKATLIVK